MIRFTTSSSHDEARYTRAGTLSFVQEPGAKAKAILESFDRKTAVSSPQPTRRERLHKRIRNIFSRFTRSDVRETERDNRCLTYPYDTIMEDEYDFLNDSWFFKDDGVAHQPFNRPDCIEMPSSHGKIELPPHMYMQNSGDPCGPPIAELCPMRDPQPVELSGDSGRYSNGHLTVDVIQAQTNVSSNVAVPPGLDALPQLSPQGIPQEDSPVSSLTPSPTHNVMVSPHFDRVSYDSSVSPGSVTRFQIANNGKHLQTIQDMQAQSFDTFEHTAPNILLANTNANATMPPMDWQQVGNESYQMDALPAYQTTLQRAATMPTRLPEIERRLLEQFGQLEGTFELDETLSFTRCPVNAMFAPEPPLPLPSEQDGGYPTAAMGAGSAEQTSYNPVKCKHCDAQFTGRYALNNQRRHIKHQHLSTSSVNVDRLTCRICKTSYKRGDALRTHLWKKHSLSEARPKTRAAAS